VILPELDGSLTHREDRLLTMRPDPEGEIEVVTHALKKEISVAHAELERVRVDVARRRMVEELCVLYVAMTRAKHRLDLIVQGREEEGGGLTYAAILRGALKVPAAGADGAAWEHPESKRSWFGSEIAAVEEFVAPSADAIAVAKTSESEGARADTATRATTGAAASAGAGTRATASAGSNVGAGTRGITGAGASANVGTNAREDARAGAGAGPSRKDAGGSDEGLTPAKKSLRLALSLRSRSLPGLSPSHAKDVGAVRASTLLQAHDAMTVRGRLIHRFLEEVEWIETFDRSDEDLLAIGRTIEANDRTLASAIAEFRAALARPVTKGVLSRPGGEVEVWRERRFTLVMPGPDGKESLWTGAFDRVVIRREKGRAISAQIVDYKTDRVERDALAERAKSYGSQMDAYRRALAIITGLAVGDIEAQLLFLSRDAVIAKQ